MRFQLGAPQRLTRLVYSVVVMPQMVGCLALSGCVYWAFVSGNHESAPMLPERCVSG